MTHNYNLSLVLKFPHSYRKHQVHFFFFQNKPMQILKCYQKNYPMKSFTLKNVCLHSSNILPTLYHKIFIFIKNNVYSINIYAYYFANASIGRETVRCSRFIFWSKLFSFLYYYLFYIIIYSPIFIIIYIFILIHVYKKLFLFQQKKKRNEVCKK